MAVDLEKYRKQPTGSTPIDINKYRKAPAAPAQTFNVPEPANYRENRIKQFQAEAAQSQAEAEKANSFWGKTKAFGKAMVKNIAPSETGLGKTIGGLLYQGSKSQVRAQDALALSEDVKYKLAKTIREQEAQGKDTTRLKQAYNEQEKSVADATRTARDLVQLPSNLKALGQIGGTALDVLTAGTYSKAKTGVMNTGRLFSGSAPVAKTLATAAGAPELGAIAGQKAAGLFSLRGAGNIAKGASLGYASDVALGLQGERGENREGVAAFIPGLGTAFGTAIPAASEITQTVKNVVNPEPRIVEKRMQGLKDLETKNGKIAKVFDAADRRGIDVRKTLAETNLLNGAIDPDGRISSDKALNNFNEFIQPYEGKVKEALASENRSVQINQLVEDAKDFINKSSLSDRQKVELQQEIAGQLDAFAQFRGKAVPVTALHDTKVVLANSNNYLNPSKNIVDKEAARFFKELVENNTSSMDVAKYNGELSKYYTVREALESMDRAVVSGGRMGKYFSSLIGSGVGGLAGGPIGAIVGAEAGAKARGSMLSRAFGRDINKGLEATPELIDALNPKATGKAAIPDVILPKTKPKIPDVNIGTGSFKTGAIPLTKKTKVPVRKPMEKLTGVPKLQQRATTKGYDYNAIKASVEKRIADSTPDKKYTDDNARSIAESVPDAQFIEAPLKGADCTLEKVINETKTGDVSEIKDIARNTIMPITKEAHAQVVAKMDARKDIYARKPQEGKDFMGYKGMIYNIKSPSGNITETQVVSPEMMFGKMLPEDSKRILGAEKFAEIQKRTGLKPGYGHEIYDKIRKMTRKEKASAAGQKLIKESEDYYAQLSSF